MRLSCLAESGYRPADRLREDDHSWIPTHWVHPAARAMQILKPSLQ